MIIRIPPKYICPRHGAQRDDSFFYFFHLQHGRSIIRLNPIYQQPILPAARNLSPMLFLTAMLAAQSRQHGLAKASYRNRRAPLPTSGLVQRAPISSFSLTTISSYLFRTACLLLQFSCARIGRRWIPIKMATLTFQMKEQGQTTPTKTILFRRPAKTCLGIFRCAICCLSATDAETLSIPLS